MSDSTKEEDPIFEIHLAAGGASVAPGLCQVKAGSIIRWTISSGSGRIVFRSPGSVIFASDLVTPETPVSGLAADRGTHYFGIVVWPANYVLPYTIGAVLIVE